MRQAELGGSVDVLDTVLGAVGDTPLVRLGKVARGVQPTVLAKLEMLNPGGSVKDRIGLRMIEAAEREGHLKPRGTIVEPTSGNTGHGLAIAAALRGYRCIFVMPDKMSQEKISLLRAYGAEVVICPTAVPPESPESYYRVADRLAEEIPGAFQPNQYFNPENPAAHYETTGPEIWRQTDGSIDVLVAGVGTGGTISGAARYLKEQKPDLLVVGADPEGSIYSGDVHPYLTEGIGEDFWPTTFDPSLVDRYVRVSDRDAFRMARRITREEGILVGSSSGTAVVAALAVASELPDGTTVVVILPDTGRNYLSKAYSDTWLLQYGLMERPEIVRVEEVLSAKHGHVPPLITVNARDKVRQAIDVLHEYNISQAPVVREAGVDVAQFVGGVHENALLDRIFRDPDALQADVAEVMGPPIGLVEFDAPIELAFQTLQHGPAVLVEKAGEVLGVLTRSDLLEFLAHRSRV
jgi:cystathionine beta-synthase